VARSVGDQLQSEGGKTHQHDVAQRRTERRGYGGAKTAGQRSRGNRNHIGAGERDDERIDAGIDEEVVQRDHAASAATKRPPSMEKKRAWPSNGVNRLLSVPVSQACAPSARISSNNAARRLVSR